MRAKRLIAPTGEWIADLDDGSSPSPDRRHPAGATLATEPVFLEIALVAQLRHLIRLREDDAGLA